MKRVVESLFPIIIFLLLTLSLGSLYLRNVGPKSVGDYDMHMFNTYVVATGQMHAEFENDPDSHNMKKMVFHGPANLLSRTGADWTYEGKVLSPFEKDDKLQAQIDSYKNTSSKIIKELDRTQYPPLNWVIPAVGMRVALNIHASPYNSWQLARIANLIGFVAIMIIAIILIPRGKWLLVAIGSFPLSVFLASSVSGDAVNISVSSLFVALALNMRFRAYNNEGTISKMEMFLLGFFVVIFFNLKVAYVPILLLILIIPNFFFTFKNKLIVLSTAGIAGVISYLMWSKTYSTVLTGFSSLSANLSFVKHHLFSSVYAVIVFAINTPLHFLSGIGNQDVWSKLGTATSLFGVFIFLVTIFFNVDVFKKGSTLSFKEKNVYYFPIVMSVVIYLLVMMITLFALLTTWTKVYGVSAFDLTNIQGVQVRYLLPLMPLLAVIYSLNDKKIVFRV